MDYSKTVNLPVTDFPMKADLPTREPMMLAQWEKERVYERALAQRLPAKESKRFILHDGPPYANGHLHLGHALNKILKDIIVRFKTMTGHYAPYVPGWDCHGLPIELQLMKELKVTDKHKVDRAVFRGQAKAFAEKFVGIQKDEFKRLGVLGDWDHPYLTMDDGYKKSIVATFEELRDKGYIYRGKKPVYWCPTDETALAEAEVEYENRTDRAIYVAFPTSEPDTFYAIWTTTPWTLPANVAIAYNKRFQYYKAKDNSSGRWFILAGGNVLDSFAKATGIHLTNPTLLTPELFPAARHPWIDRESKVVEAEFVTDDAGTGLVHIAPGHGADDFAVGQKNKLPTLSPVNDRGLFTDEVPEWKGEHVFKANPLLIEFLRTKGLLIWDEAITHSYPHCWRCHRPVIFRATEQWFLKIDHEGLRERALKALEQVAFYPDFGRKRISGMMSTRPDWCLSRQRLWGTEIPGGSATTADPDIFDVWFESGVSWRAVLEARPELHQPADLYLEGSDQHRGWFQVSLIPSVALENRAPFKSLLTHGFVMDGAGRPMSKSVGNVISPEEIIKQYGADLLRLWVASSDYTGDVRLSPEILKGLTDTYRKIRNTFRYLLGNSGGVKVSAVAFADRPELDRWALAQLREVSEKVASSFEKFEFHRGVSALVDFCGSTLSGFYLDTLKDRLYCDPPESLSGRSARSVLAALADTLCRLWAPVLSFTADEAWRALGHSDSVALSDFPVLPGEWTSADHAEVFQTRETILLALEKARQGRRIKGNLEAHVILFSSDEKKREWLKSSEARWPLWCIVSQASVSSVPLSAPDASAHGVEVWIDRAAGQKCARCWIYKTDVGADSRYSDICKRCADAIQERGQPSPAGVSS